MILIVLQIFLALVLIVFTLASTLYFYITQWQYKKWQRYKIPYVTPKFPHGSFKYGGLEHVTTLYQQYHNQFKSLTPIYGTFTLIIPTLTVTSLDLAKRIFTQDFPHFHDRFTNYVVKHDYLTKNLVRLEGDEWKNLRRKLSPTFSSGHMKHMFPTILSVAEKAAEIMGTSDSAELDMKNFFSSYATDVIGTCIFGLQCNSLQNKDDIFKAMGQRIIQVNRSKSFLLSVFPNIAALFKMTLFDENAREFYTNIVRETLAHRETENVDRNDFIDVMIRARKTDVAEDKLSQEEITAQLVLFYTAGMDNTSTTLTFTLFELAQNPQLQTTARENVRNNIQKHNGFNYEAISSMSFLEQCINETLRKYPPSPIITRNTTKDYKVDELKNFIIQKGTRVTIPIYCFHHDAEYFPEPEKYDPYRFSTTAHHKAFFPFGEGPRACIAARFGLLKIRIALAVLLNKFKFTVSEQTKLPLEFNSKVPMLHLKDKLFLNWSLLGDQNE